MKIENSFFAAIVILVNRLAFMLKSGTRSSQ